MNSYTIFKSRPAVAFFCVLSVISLLFTSCEDDESLSGEMYFTIEDNPTGLSVDNSGITKSFVVRSNRNWQVVSEQENEWVRAFPEEGEGDGIFKFIVEQNETFDARTVNFSFIVDGEEQPVLFLVEQEANVPYITIPEAEDGISLASSGGEISIDVQSNVIWVPSLEDNDWLSVQEVGDTQVKLLADKNSGDKRIVTLTLTASDYPSVTRSVEIVQARGSVLIQEDFSWLSYGSAVPYETSGEKRYDSWTEEEKNHGWYSTPVEVSSNQQIVYARQGFVKLGKTNYGGDLISSKLDIEGTATVEVTFKAAAYISAGGNVDDNILRVSALGAGEASVSQLIIDNIPNSKAQDEDGVVNDIWAEDRAYSFTITGATSETQVRFLGGDFALSGVGQGKNRIFLDDIKVEIVE